MPEWKLPGLLFIKLPSEVVLTPVMQHRHQPTYIRWYKCFQAINNLEKNDDNYCG